VACKKNLKTRKDPKLGERSGMEKLECGEAQIEGRKAVEYLRRRRRCGKVFSSLCSPFRFDFD